MAETGLFLRAARCASREYLLLHGWNKPGNELELEGDCALAGLRGDTKTLFHALDLLERVVPIATELDELRLQGARPRPH